MSRAQLTSTVEQNTGGAVAPYVAGKNKLINGDFSIWQRGTTLTLTSNQGYIADRWYSNSPGSDTVVYSQQPLTAGAAPVAGYNGTYCMQMSWASTLVSYPSISQRVEDVRTFANQTVTLSFWAKATSSVNINTTINQNFGSGGSATVNGSVSTFAVTSSWQRFVYTATLGSMSGKTIGTNSYLDVTAAYFTPTTTANTVQFWGVQVEAGSVATPFTTASGTLQGELAAAMRYYYRTNGASNSTTYAVGHCENTTTAIFPVALPVPMRVVPTSIDFAGLRVYSGSTVGTTGTFVLSGTYSTTTSASVVYTHGSSLFTAGYAAELDNASTGAAYLGFGAEL